MLNWLRFTIMNARQQWRLLNEAPVPQPMYDGFRTPILTREERLDAKRQRAPEILAEHFRMSQAGR